MDTEKIGIAAMVLGAGRKKEDIIDFTVGLILRKIGNHVKKVMLFILARE